MIRLHVRVNQYGDTGPGYVDTDDYSMTTARGIMERPNGMFELVSGGDLPWQGHFLLPACQVVLITALG